MPYALRKRAGRVIRALRGTRPVFGFGEEAIRALEAIQNARRFCLILLRAGVLIHAWMAVGAAPGVRALTISLRSLSRRLGRALSFLTLPDVDGSRSALATVSLALPNVDAGPGVAPGPRRQRHLEGWSGTNYAARGEDQQACRDPRRGFVPAYAAQVFRCCPAKLITFARYGHLGAGRPAAKPRLPTQAQKDSSRSSPVRLGLIPARLLLQGGLSWRLCRFMRRGGYGRILVGQGFAGCSQRV